MAGVLHWLIEEPFVVVPLAAYLWLTKNPAGRLFERCPVSVIGRARAVRCTGFLRVRFVGCVAVALPPPPSPPSPSTYEKSPSVGDSGGLQRPLALPILRLIQVVLVGNSTRGNVKIGARDGALAPGAEGIWSPRLESTRHIPRKHLVNTTTAGGDCSPAADTVNLGVRI